MRTRSFRKVGKWVVALLLAMAPHSHAILDSNGNLLSDVWEKHFNGGYLLANTPANAATADPDKDGWTNADEAIAGTSPFNPNPPAGRVSVGFFRHPAAQGVFLVSWASLPGKLYQMKVSTDLATWANFDGPMSGTGAPVEIAFDAAFEDGNLPEALFVRVIILDTDPDGDGLSSWEELDPSLALDPNSPDTDLDGILDGVDASPKSSATVADPDGCNSPAGIDTGLRGFWDFESSTISGSNSIFPDRSGANRHATGELIPVPLGMPSLAAKVGPTLMQVPKSVTQGQATYTVSGWFKLGKGSLQNPTNNGLFYTIFAVYDRGGEGPSPQKAPLGQGFGLFVRKSSAGESWLIGGYRQTTLPNGNATTGNFGWNFDLPAGTSDDGQWHHFVASHAGGTDGQRVYLDGQLKVQGGLRDYSVSYDADTYFTFGRLHPYHDQLWLEAYVDRVRVHSRLLSEAESVALYQQDIDRDTLWDITENKTLLWRDNNDNMLREAAEQTYLSSPFRWQAAEIDTDGDGATDAEEQLAGTKMGVADTDGDGMPDGWELHHGLDAKLASDALLDNDVGGGDGLNNLQEFIWNTDPKKRDTDGDGKNDGPEITDRGNPNDGTDGGAVPATERFSVKLGVGDRSGSKSETYFLHCYRLDPATGQETRVYTLVPTPTANDIYKEEVQNFFHKGETYTFQIDWQNSTEAGHSTAPLEGADFDYHLVIEPQGTDHGTVLIDSYDPATFTVDAVHPLRDLHDTTAGSDDDDDVTTFLSTHEPKRVALASVMLVGAQSGEIDGGELTLKKINKPKVAKWENAFIDNQFGGNYATLKENFIGYDPDRFWVQFLKIAGEKISVGTRTDSFFPVAADPINEIALDQVNNTGLWTRSRSQILVANEVDDKLGIRGAGRDESSKDRSHLVNRFGSLRVEIRAPNLAMVQTDIQRPYSHFASIDDCVIIPDSDGTVPMQPTDFAPYVDQNAFPRYLQCDMYVYAGPSAAHAVTRPAGMTSPKGLLVKWPYPPQTLSDTFAEAMEPVLNAYGTADTTDLQLFLFTSVRREAWRMQPNGTLMGVESQFAFANNLEWVGTALGSKSCWTVFYGPNNENPSTHKSEDPIVLAHEIGHILTASGHYSGVNQWTNIMKDAPMITVPLDAEATGNWRWFQSQDNAIKTSQFVGENE